MKRVVLLGDSIRLGYEATVRAQIADIAFVWSPSENGQHTVNLLMNFWQWAVAQQPDVLHLNAGLWDTRRLARNKPGNLIPLDDYRTNIDRLFTLARAHTHARIIWATTTPVNQEHTAATHLRSGLAGRDAADIARYNAAAVEVARRHDVLVNDLHQVVCSAGSDACLSPDGVHFTAEAYDLLGRAVAKSIRSALAAQ